MATLSGDFRDVLVAVDIAGLSYKEAAHALRIREGTVMSRLYRARQEVVRKLEAARRRQPQAVGQRPCYRSDEHLLAGRAPDRRRPARG